MLPVFLSQTKNKTMYRHVKYQPRRKLFDLTREPNLRLHRLALVVLKLIPSYCGLQNVFFVIHLQCLIFVYAVKLNEEETHRGVTAASHHKTDDITSFKIAATAGMRKRGVE